MFELNYTKHKNNLLFETLEKNEMTKLQNYIPIYEKWFSLNPTNFNNINLNQKYSIHSVIEKKTDNKYYCKLVSPLNNQKKMCFFKFSPLLDPVRYMVGKYTITDKLLNLPKLSNNDCHKKIIDNNNSAYVDGFFSYLTSQLLHTNRFCHGLDFFGSFIGVKKKFKYNVFDDLDYLSESKFFHANTGSLFNLNGLDEDLFLHDESRRERPPLKLGECVQQSSVSTFNQSLFDKVFFNEDNTVDLSQNKKLIFTYDCSSNTLTKLSKLSKSSHSSSTCSSRSSVTDLSSVDDSDSGDSCSDSGDSCSDSGDSYSTNADMGEEMNIVINDFPVNIICLESLDNTFDSLLTSNKQITIPEWKSFIFQIIMTLITYQELFKFTHNDLHTNNIMFQKTDKQFINYYYKKKYYKVPTFGKIFKIIDFGRAIYWYKNKIVCSDSFHPKGDAATQYNIEPYLNKKKPRIEQNFSFDLCRLACSLFDHFVPIFEMKNKVKHPIGKLIIEWCTDDNGLNILYKKNGDERYPDFKLYKMISRKVHRCIPQKQVDKELFREYQVTRKEIGKKKRFINLDMLFDSM